MRREEEEKMKIKTTRGLWAPECVTPGGRHQWGEESPWGGEGTALTITSYCVRCGAEKQWSRPNGARGGRTTVDPRLEYYS